MQKKKLKSTVEIETRVETEEAKIKVTARRGNEAEVRVGIRIGKRGQRAEIAAGTAIRRDPGVGTGMYIMLIYRLI